MKGFLVSPALFVALCTPAYAGLTQIIGTGTGGNIGLHTSTSATTEAMTVNVAVAAGSMVIIGTDIRTGQTNSCTDSEGNSYSSRADLQNGLAGVRFFFNPAIITALTTSDTITCTFAQNTANKGVVALAFSNANATQPDASSVTATGSSTIFAAGPTGTLGCPGGGANCEVVIALSGYANNPTVFTEDIGFTSAGNILFGRIAFSIKSASTAVSYAPLMTMSSGQWVVDLAGFEAASSGGLVYHGLSSAGAGR